MKAQQYAYNNIIFFLFSRNGDNPPWRDSFLIERGKIKMKNAIKLARKDLKNTVNVLVNQVRDYYLCVSPHPVCRDLWRCQSTSHNGCYRSVGISAEQNPPRSHDILFGKQPLPNT